MINLNYHIREHYLSADGRFHLFCDGALRFLWYGRLPALSLCLLLSGLKDNAISQHGVQVHKGPLKWEAKIQLSSSVLNLIQCGFSRQLRWPLSDLQKIVFKSLPSTPHLPPALCLCHCMSGCPRPADWLTTPAVTSAHDSILLEPKLRSKPLSAAMPQWWPRNINVKLDVHILSFLFPWHSFLWRKVRERGPGPL